MPGSTDDMVFVVRVVDRLSACVRARTSIAQSAHHLPNQQAHTLSHRLHRPFTGQLFHALHPAAIRRHAHALRLKDHRVLALLLELEHHFSRPRRVRSGALQLRQHLFRRAIEINPDSHAARQLHLYLFERLYLAHRDLGRGVFFAHQLTAHQHRRLDLQLLRPAVRSRAQSR